MNDHSLQSFIKFWDNILPMLIIWAEQLPSKLNDFIMPWHAITLNLLQPFKILHEKEIVL